MRRATGRAELRPAKPFDSTQVPSMLPTQVMGAALARTLAAYVELPVSDVVMSVQLSAAFGRVTRIEQCDRHVPPDSLSDRMREASAVCLDLSDAASPWTRAVAGRLGSFWRAERTTFEDASAIRLASLCLAAQADTVGNLELADILRQIATGVTAFQHREGTHPPPRETIVLVRA
jgi:hypothetical protein